VTRLSRTLHLTRVAVITWKAAGEEHWGLVPSSFFPSYYYSGMRFASSIIIEKQQRGEREREREWADGSEALVL
jgi:hypothetical protein